METQRDGVVHSHNLEKEELVTVLERTKEDMAGQLLAMQRDRDDSLLLAENEKQQVCSVIYIIQSLRDVMLHMVYTVY